MEGFIAGFTAEVFAAENFTAEGAEKRGGNFILTAVRIYWKQ